MRTQTAATGSAAPAIRRTQVLAILGALVLVVLDAAIANVALPAIARSLAVTPASSVLVVTAYQLALVMGLMPCAALGESLGHRRVFTAGIGLFTAASVVCAVSPSLPWLVAARFVQGIGGAAVMALGVALLRHAVPHGRLGAALGWNALTIALSAAAGPTIGALILAAASWPWLFAVNLPVGLGVLLATRALPPLTGTRRPPDLVGMALVAGCFAALGIGAELVVERPAVATALLIACACGIRALVRRERSKEAPLVPLDLLGLGPFRRSVVASVCCFTGQAAALVALPFHLQHTFGLVTLTMGLYVTSWPLAVAVAAPIAGRLADAVSPARLCAAGAACLAIGLAASALWPLRGGPLPLIASTVLCGLGFGLFNVPNNRTMYLSVAHARSAAAGGIQGTARLTGQIAGGVLMTLLFTVASAESAARIGLGIASALTLAAGLVSILPVAGGVRDPALLHAPAPA